MSESAPQNSEKTLSSRAPAEWFGSVILGNLKNPLFWLTVALLVLAIMLIFYGILQGEVIFWGLPALQFYPWRDFAMSEFAAGRFPLWNPYNGAGAPLLANYQSAIFYPPHLLYFLFRDPRLMGWLGMLHVLWAGIGMWLFTGRLKSPSLPHFARAIAALSYPLCNTLIARFGTIPMLEVATWLPWLLLATDLIIEGYTLRRWLLLAIVLAMMLLAGHAQWTFYSLILAGCYALWMIASVRGSLRKL
ncbi:MAG: hypothetical protein KF726_27460, partial [Anaerolineae bacterium]|nr:hypothetical protein [Anaerolineae bacterium]